MKVVNYGSLNLDHVYQVDHMVRGGETLASDGYACNLGGKGLNQSIALARAGCEVWHAGQIGKEGEALREALAGDGINVKHLHTVATPTGHAIIQVDRTGQNCILLFGGANQTQTEEQMKAVIADMDSGDVLVCQNEINDMDTLTALAAEKGIRIALNPSPMNERMTPEIIRRCRWIFVNETEAEELSGISAAEPEKMMDALCAMFPGLHIVMTLGADGVMTGENADRCRGKSCRVDVVDTTAAGDTFSGYYLACVLRGEQEQTALETAATASAIAVSRKGACASIPKADEVRPGMFPWRE